MKAKQTVMTLAQKRGRVHRVLFDQDLPFRGRAEERKDAYRRQPKHRNRDTDFKGE